MDDQHEYCGPLTDGNRCRTRSPAPKAQSKASSKTLRSEIGQPMINCLSPKLRELVKPLKWKPAMNWRHDAVGGSTPAANMWLSWR